MLVYTLSTPFLGHNHDIAFRLRRRYVIIASKILGISWVKNGEVTLKPALYVCNHRTLVDPVIACIYLDAFVIAKAEVGSMPLLNKGAELSGVIYVKREDKTSRSATREKMKEIIAGGENVLVYPEGTVSGERTTLDFKKGTFMEAAANEIPVIPIALEYQSKRDHWVKISLFQQYFKQFSKWHTRAKIEFGEPIRSSDGEELCQGAQGWINEKLLEMQKGWSTAF